MYRGAPECTAIVRYTRASVLRMRVNIVYKCCIKTVVVRTVVEYGWALYIKVFLRKVFKHFYLLYVKWMRITVFK